MMNRFTIKRRKAIVADVKAGKRMPPIYTAGLFKPRLEGKLTLRFA